MGSSSRRFVARYILLGHSILNKTFAFYPGTVFFPMNFSDCIFMMYGQWFVNSRNRNLSENKPFLSSPLTDAADSGIASRGTTLSPINGVKLFIKPTIDNDNESITTENQSLSIDCIDLHKRMIVFSLRCSTLHIVISSNTSLQKMCRKYAIFELSDHLP